MSASTNKTSATRASVWIACVDGKACHSTTSRIPIPVVGGSLIHGLRRAFSARASSSATARQTTHRGVPSSERRGGSLMGDELANREDDDGDGK